MMRISSHYNTKFIKETLCYRNPCAEAMKILFVRHGLTKSNVRDYEAYFRFPDSVEKQKEYEKQVCREQGSQEVSGDSVLTEVGISEAERLRAYWGPLLEGAAEQKKLEVLVSPMHRTLETANPLMTYLHEKTRLEGNVYGDFFESGGLMSPDDEIFIEELREMVSAENEATDVAARGKIKKNRIRRYRSHKFSHVGLTLKEMKARYSWLGTRFTAMAVDDENTPWHRSHSDWSDKYIDERVERVAKMLRAKAERAPLDHILILIGHGDMNKRVMFYLLGIDTSKVTTNLQNTSCSLITIDPIKQMVCLNFFNRTPHLVNSSGGDARNLTSYAFDHEIYMPGLAEIRKEMYDFFPKSFEGRSRL